MKKFLLILATICGMIWFVGCNDSDSNEGMLHSDTSTIIFVNTSPVSDGIAEIVTEDGESLIVKNTTVIRYKRGDKLGFVKGDLNMVVGQKNITYYYRMQKADFRVDPVHTYVEQIDVW